MVSLNDLEKPTLLYMNSTQSAKAFKDLKISKSQIFGPRKDSNSVPW